MQEQKQVTFFVNQKNQPQNPEKLPKSDEKSSLEARYKNIQAWKSECPQNLLNYKTGNGLVNAVYLAFDKHYNLELSPDDIWLAILQGFSSHLELNHEKLRKQFVNFDGKKELWIRRDQFAWGSNENDWAGCFYEWCGQIKDNIGEQNYSNLIPKFTESSQISQACFNATLMDSMKHYFEFGCMTMCGIPQVKLTGTLEDWKQVKERVENLGQYDLEWWTKILIPILDKFIESYQGKVDNIFWNCIYKVVPAGLGSGAVTTVTGWILNFFPYINSDQGKVKNEYLRDLQGIYENYKKLEGVNGDMDDDFYGPQGIMEDDLILGGITQTPFKWNYLGSEKQMVIIAGFHNVCYEEGFIKPAKGWAIAEKNPENEQQQFEEKYFDEEEEM